MIMTNPHLRRTDRRAGHVHPMILRWCRRDRSRLVLRAQRGRDRQRAHFEGLPVEFIADAISTVGAEQIRERRRRDLPRDEPSTTTASAWTPTSTGSSRLSYPISPVPDYATWLARFWKPLRALPETQRQASSVASAAGEPVSPNTRSTDPGRRQITSERRCRSRDRTIPGHSAHHRVCDRQIHHRPEAARDSLTPPRPSHPSVHLL